MTTEIELPTPDAAFRWTREGWGHALRCRPLEHIAQHLFTSRQLQLRPAEHQAAAWTEAVSSVGGSPDRLVHIRQVHGREVHVAREPLTQTPAEERPAADAIVSGLAGAVLAVQVADCAPILLADSKRGVAAAIHSGWRGASAGVIPATIEALDREFKTDPSDLTAAIGPSIGACCYQVGPDLRDTFHGAGHATGDLDRWFSRAPDGSWQLDLWLATADQLARAGVARPQIHHCRLCTKTHTHIFDSYRADGPDAGRMAALIRVPEAVR